jgi:alpha-D-ribose 1-methylphosphonate 5-triphosphate synthase subunit PhnG
MARDAIARQYDVEKNKVVLTCDTDKGGYRPGTIRFEAKQSKSIDLDKLRESIAATRLSGGTDMGMDYLEITATGTVAMRNKELVLKVGGTGEEFVLGEAPVAKDAVVRLRDAVARGERVTSVIGRVPSWNGKFPAVLKALAETSPDAVRTLQVRDFAIAPSSSR